MPDITNDFDNNPNTEKQRDEEVNNDNLKPEQTESEPELLDSTKSKEFSIPIFAKLYDKCNLKIDELNLKNDKLNAKVEKLSNKKARNAEFISTIDSMKNIVPRPVYTALSLLSSNKRQKIVNINNKIDAYKLSIKSNERKIQKHQNRAENCKKINKFLDNMKSPDGRKENFVRGIQEYRTMAIKATSEKFDNTQNKLDAALKAYGQTHYMSEKLKLRKQIDKLTDKKEKLINKLKFLDEWSDKFETVKSMPDKEADSIINKSCQNIVDEFTNNPQALKKQADVIVRSASSSVLEELTVSPAARSAIKENYLKNAEMSIEDDYDSIDGIINNGNKQEEYEKMNKTQNTEPESKKTSEDKSADDENTRITVYENFTDFGNYFTENRLSGAIGKEYTVEFGKIKNVEFFENQNGELMYKSTGLHGDEFINSVAESLKEAHNSNAIQLVVTYANGYKNGFQQLNTIKVNPEKVFNGDGEIVFDKAEHNAEKQPKQQKKSLISRKQVKQNADKIAHTHNEQRNNTKSKEQEL